MNMKWKKISDAVVRRLPLYLRVLEQAGRDKDKKLMSSHELGEKAGVSPALVRKDLAWFGEFGKQGVGYEIAYLKDELRRILNLQDEIRVCLIGVGSLGHALARYNQRRYLEDRAFNLNLIALFDNDSRKYNELVGAIEVTPLDQFEQKVKQLDLKMAIITVPAEYAQDVADRVVKAGIRAILNFAPTKVLVPEGIHLAEADLSLEMQRLAYYLESSS